MYFQKIIVYKIPPGGGGGSIASSRPNSDMDSENLSSLIRLSVSNGQKTDSSKVVSVIGI